MAERIKHRPGVVTVSAVVHVVVGEGGQVGSGFVEGDGEPAGGVVLAEQHVGHGVAALAGIPGLNDGGNVFVFPVQRDGAAGAVDDDHRLVAGGGHDGL